MGPGREDERTGNRTVETPRAATCNAAAPAESCHPSPSSGTRVVCQNEHQVSGSTAREESIVQLSEGTPAKPKKTEKRIRLRQLKQDDANALEEAYQAAEAEREHLH